MLNEEVIHHIKSLTPLVYVVTNEEDRFIVDFHNQFKELSDTTWVYSSTLGLKKIKPYIEDWTTKENSTDIPTSQINEAFLKIYKDKPGDKDYFYLITDPERWFKDEHLVRRTLNIVHQVNQDTNVAKCLIFVGSRRFIPAKLSRYCEVVNCTSLTAVEVKETAEKMASLLSVEIPDIVQRSFQGMSSYEIERVCIQSVVKTKIIGKEISPSFVSEYRKNQIRKTDLVQILDTDLTFNALGGAQQFKDWAQESKSCWSKEGQNFGLVPPKGVLLVGVYGCGKSLSAKALASEWQLPLVQFEMGKLRSSGVGDSEGNLYQALQVIESVAPCVVFIDEAEKSLSGGASSAASDAGTTSRLLGILSTWTQETKVPVCLVMTANSLKNLPVEMINRMSERFFFDIPDADTRVEIIKIQAKKLNQNVSNFQLGDLAEKAKLLVGREIEQALASAMVKSFNAGKPALDEEILAEEFTSKPRIVKTMGDDIKEVMDWVGWDPTVNEGIRARLASKKKSELFKVLLSEES